VFVFVEWSAPSAIGIAGLGGGFEIGAEVIYHCLIWEWRVVTLRI
jgi:lipid-binding SYLF domain-containing protein